MCGIAVGMDDVAALSDLIQSPGSLRELTVDEVGQSVALETEPPPVFQQLLRTILSSSSLETLHIRHYSTFPLDDIENISGSLSTLSVNTSPEQPTANLGVKGGTKLSHIIKKNTSLKRLGLLLPLGRDEVRDIVHSLEDNDSLEELWLSESLHFEYFAESEQQVLDPRIHFHDNYYNNNCEIKYTNTDNQLQLWA